MSRTRSIQVVEETTLVPGENGARQEAARPRPGTSLAAAASILRQVDPRLGSKNPLRRGYLFRRMLVASDLLALAGAYGVMALVLTLADRQAFDLTMTIEFVLLIPVWVMLAELIGLYHLSERRVDHSFADEIGPVATVTTLWSWFLLVVNAALSNEITALMGPMVAWAAAIALVICLRALARRAARGASWFRQPILLIGGDEDVARVLRRVVRHPELGLDPVAALCIRPSSYELQPLGVLQSLAPPELPGRGPGRPRPEDVQELIARAGISRVIVTGWSESVSERTELMRVLAEAGVCIDYVSGEPEALYSTAVLHHIEGLPILTIRPMATRATKILKRAIDITVSASGLTLLSPLLAYVALRIKLGSSGPVLFRQQRAGMDGHTFEVLKLRTMIDGADQMRDGMRAQEPRLAEAKMLKLREDPRITPFGARLRRWSIDELPQLWNVLRGDMSLVGPRPLPLDEAAYVDGHFAERLRMRPGLTGPWQIHGRSDIPFDDMVKLDYMYVASWTMREDLRLLARTLGTVIHGRGAY